MINSLFGFEFRLRDIDKQGDPLAPLAAINWELFRPLLAKVREKERKSNAGRPAWDVVLMFKILILQSLYNLADDNLQFQIMDRMSFMRFLGLAFEDGVPDAKTVWLFREQLTKAELVRPCFDRFNEMLDAMGLVAKKGQIIDASIVPARVQHNKPEENERIKEGGGAPADWKENKRRQKDVDARWTKKREKPYYGFKNHVQTDVKHKFIRDYDVTDASVHDSQVFVGILDKNNTSRDVWGDSAYRSAKALETLDELGYRGNLQYKGARDHPLTAQKKKGNKTRARIRARVEHIFGVQSIRAGCNLVIRTIGMARAKTKIGLRNLAYNIDRYAKKALA